VSRALGLVVAGLLVCTAGWAAGSLAPSEAIGHVGRHAQVCGDVVSTRYAASANGQPTFLNFGRPYPNQDFTAVIWGSARPAFPYAPESLRGQMVCVRGLITTYRGTAQIVVSDPLQIERPDGSERRR
jgi:DNA/RNA endonuclease YhcR with UshA esterase domain